MWWRRSRPLFCHIASLRLSYHGENSIGKKSNWKQEFSKADTAESLTITETPQKFKTCSTYYPIFQFCTTYKLKFLTNYPWFIKKCNKAIFPIYFSFRNESKKVIKICSSGNPFDMHQQSWKKVQIRDVSMKMGFDDGIFYQVRIVHHDW